MSEKLETTTNDKSLDDQQRSNRRSLKEHKKSNDRICNVDISNRRPSYYGDVLTVTPVIRARSRSISVSNGSCRSVSTKANLCYGEIFTDQQKSHLRQSWSHIGKHGHSGIGAMIFRRIFERRPTVRRMFEFGMISTSNLDNDPTFEVHSRNFINVIDGAIKSLDNFEETYVPELLSKGRFHTQLINKGFKNEYWDVFAEATTDSIVEWIGPGKHREITRAWTLLISCIIEHMRIGYEQESKRRTKANSHQCLNVLLNADEYGNKESKSNLHFENAESSITVTFD